MSQKHADRSTPDERHEEGTAARKVASRSSHAEWSPPADRRDPVDVITDQDAARLKWLVPIRHQRMGESSFAFYRGAAAIMAADLASTPVSGLQAQLCGDAHLSNFGSFASAERRQVFDVNDFDETLPGPWEWDVKRLATSFVLAGRENGFAPEKTRSAANRAVREYRSATDAGHHYYWRQFHDMKGSADVATQGPRRLEQYAEMCGWTLAHAHARSGDPIAISGYLGKGNSFDKAITRFAETYADQNDADYTVFRDAIDSGRVTAASG